MESQVRNILFNEFKEEDVRPGTIYNGNLFKICMQLFMVLLLCQYILVYVCVPFDNIQERPSMLIVSSLYCLFMSCVNATLLPICSSTTPTTTSLHCLVISSVLELLGMISTLLASVLAFQAHSMISIEHDNGTTKKVDMTLFIRVSTIISFVVCVCTWILSAVNVVLVYRAICLCRSSRDRIQEY